MRHLKTVLMLGFLCLSVLPAFSMPAGWTNARRLTNDANQSLYPTITCNAVGNSVFAAWADDRDGYWEIYFMRSFNEGLTWSPASNITNNATDSTCPYLHWYANTLLLTWLDYRGGSADVYAMKSADDGTSWTDLLGIAGQVTNVSGRGNTGASFSRPMATINPFGTHVVWADNTSGSSKVYYRRAVVGPVVSIKPDSTAATLPAIATLNYGMFPDPTLYIVWEEAPGENSSIYFTRSADGGVTWTDGNGAPGSYDISFKFNSCAACQPYIFVSSDTAAGVDVGFIDNRQGTDQIYWEAGRTDAGLTITWDNGMWGMDSAPNTITTTAVAPDWLAMSPRNGSEQSLVWHENRDFNNELYLCTGMGGGSIPFSPEIRLTFDSADSILPAIITNDVFAAMWNRQYLVWSDNRDSNYEIYYKRTDTIGPNSISDLSASTGGPGEVDLQWTSPADDITDPVWFYDMRYCNTQMTTLWEFRTNGTPISQTITPLPAGQTEAYTVSGLVPGNLYYFAVISVDQAGNSSNVSNSPGANAGLPYTATPTSTISATCTPSPSISPTPSVSPTATVSATNTMSQTISPTGTISATNTMSPTISQTSTISPTATNTPTITITSTISPTGTISPTSTLTPTLTTTPTYVAQEGEGALQAYPNPATDRVTFNYGLEKAGEVYFAIYNMAGELVVKIKENKSSGGSARTEWDTSKTPSGIYLVRLRVKYNDGTSREFDIKKIAIVKK